MNSFWTSQFSKFFSHIIIEALKFYNSNKNLPLKSQKPKIYNHKKKTFVRIKWISNFYYKIRQ